MQAQWLKNIFFAGKGALGGLNFSLKQLAAAVVVIALAAWRVFGWSFLPTALNALLVLYILYGRQSLPKAHGIVRRRRHKASAGVWRVKLIKAEIVSDEPWSGEQCLTPIMSPLQKYCA